MQKSLLIILIFSCAVFLYGCTTQTSNSSDNMHSATSEKLNKLKNNYSDNIKSVQNSTTTYTSKDDVLKINLH